MLQLDFVCYNLEFLMIYEIFIICRNKKNLPNLFYWAGLLLNEFNFNSFELLWVSCIVFEQVFRLKFQQSIWFLLILEL